MTLVFVDCEAYGGAPCKGRLTEFGAVTYPEKKTFYGVIVPTKPSAANPAIPEPLYEVDDELYMLNSINTIMAFDKFLSENCKGRPIFVSDNPAFDWQWINDLFWKYLDRNPFGHSARRIGDFYAGLVGNFYTHNDWKKLRITKHTHNPVDDAMGNVEAFERLLKGERP